MNTDVIENAITKREWEDKIARDERTMPKGAFMKKYSLLDINDLREDFESKIKGARYILMSLRSDPSGKVGSVKRDSTEFDGVIMKYKILSTSKRVFTLMRLNDAGKELYPVSLTYQDVRTMDNIKYFKIVY